MKGISMIRSVDDSRDGERARSWTGMLASAGVFAATLSLISIVATLTVGASVFAQEDAVAPGTVITLKNWQSYKQFMPEGIRVLFQGSYHWKMPPDFQMVVGPTHSYPVPGAYRDNTEKYSKNVSIRTLPNGLHVLEGYVAGAPFPHPEEPMKGYKIFADTWYSYVPYIACGDQIHFTMEDRLGNLHRERAGEVIRRFSHISDPVEPISDLSRPHGVYMTEYIEVMEPEESRYTGQLGIWYEDVTRNEDLYLFIPALRRTLRMAAAARCSPVIGTDFTQDDDNVPGGFSGDIARFDAKFLRDQEILVVTEGDLQKFTDLSYFYRPILFPNPFIAKWEVRNTYVIDVRRVPSMASGYCYGSRVMYVDKQTHQVLWSDLYDANMKLWKTLPLISLAAPVPHVGTQLMAFKVIGPMIDFQNSHMTLMQLDDAVNDDCRSYKGTDFTNTTRYSSIMGLNEILR